MIEVILLVMALSIDAFVASTAYGVDGIKIPLKSAFALSGISSLILLLSMAGGALISGWLPPQVTGIVCFVLLLLLGMSRFCEGLIKDVLSRHANHVQGITFKCWDYHFILDIYMDNTKADCDQSKVLSVKEAISLGIVLSLDGIAAGFGSGLVETPYMETLIVSMLVSMVAILLGCALGCRLANLKNLQI
ncbi:MAG: sporulation membrane protein YtaF, partial [Niameybacter sp.]